MFWQNNDLVVFPRKFRQLYITLSININKKEWDSCHLFHCITTDMVNFPMLSNSFEQEVFDTILFVQKWVGDG